MLQNVSEIAAECVDLGHLLQILRGNAVVVENHLDLVPVANELDVSVTAHNKQRGIFSLAAVVH